MGKSSDDYHLISLKSCPTFSKSKIIKIGLMKTIKSTLFSAFFILLFVSLAFGQETLPEVVVTTARYKYLSAVDNKEVAQPVKLLERKAAEFDVKNSEFYDDEYEEYYISFYIPSGYILATYSKDGKLMHTAERYKNVALPNAVAQALYKKYPQWGIPKDVYLVTYQEEKGATKIWKILLKNGDKRLRVKVNEKGEILSK